MLETEQAAKDSENIGSIGHINQEAVVQESLKLPIILIGSLIYSFGINVFLKPLHLYSGGFMGMCQLIQTLLQDYAHIIPKNADITGILYWILNAPALAYAYKKMRRRFFYKSIFSVSAITVAMAMIPIPTEPLLSDFNIYMLNRNNDFDCSKATRELGFHSRPFSESIGDTVEWLQKEGFAGTAAGS